MLKRFPVPQVKRYVATKEGLRIHIAGSDPCTSLHHCLPCPNHIWKMYNRDHLVKVLYLSGNLYTMLDVIIKIESCFARTQKELKAFLYFAKKKKSQKFFESLFVMANTLQFNPSIPSLNTSFSLYNVCKYCRIFSSTCLSS